tara:strand:+ start:2327 stop:2557 length:231 start_codon:yes stop_codon:yes gene_type:complete
MAVFRTVNRVVKATYPGRDIQAVAGRGYVYFVGDDGHDTIDSIFVHPQNTSTADVTRLVLEEIADAIKTGERNEKV